MAYAKKSVSAKNKEKSDMPPAVKKKLKGGVPKKGGRATKKQ
jgi:hypothetical protein